MTTLNVTNVKDLIGKKIRFYSEQYSANADCFGETTILSVDENNQITCSDEDSELKYAYVPEYWNDEQAYCIGDADRVVKFELV